MKWEETTIGENITTQKGFAFKSAKYVQNGIPVVRVSDYTLDSISDADLKYYPFEERYNYLDFQLHEKDVIVQTVGSWQSNPASVVGKVVRVPYFLEGALLNQNAVKLLPKESMNREFLFYRLKTDEFKGHVLGEARGAANQASITLETIKSFKFLIPDYDEQRRIADILSAYDNLIENNQKQIKLLEEAAQRLYKEWFVDLRFPGYEDTEIIDGVPEGWKKCKVGDIVATSSGGTPSRSNPGYYKDGEHLWLKTKELSDGFIFNTEEKITDDAIKSSSAKKFKAGNIIMAMYGATIGKLGISALEMTCNQACCVFDMESFENGLEYLYCWLRDNRNALILKGKGSAQPNLSQELIKSIDIILPNYKILEKFSDIVHCNFALKEKLEKQIRLSQQARDRLLPKLMSGELEV